MVLVPEGGSEQGALYLLSLASFFSVQWTPLEAQWPFLRPAEISPWVEVPSRIQGGWCGTKAALLSPPLVQASTPPSCACGLVLCVA